MIEYWTKIEAWLNKNAPLIYKSLNAGALDKDFEALEKLVNAKLPEDFKAFYKLHNGQDGDEYAFIESEELLSIEYIINSWNIWKDLDDDNTFSDQYSTPDEGIKEEWWNPKWVPFTHDGSGNHFCLDLDPAEGGTYGQVIRVWYDEEERTIEAGSFTLWLKDVLEILESGDYVYSDDYASIVNKDEV